MSPMPSRTYALALISLMAGLFLAVVGANLIIDPEAVLGTGLLGRALNSNDRYLQMRNYLMDAERYDGLLFGSSRGKVFPLDDLSYWMGGARFANFSVVGGQIVDHFAELDYIVRTKAARGKKLRAVFLLLDADFFGDRNYANRTIQNLWPPALTGESPSRFFWRYLTAIQFGAWGSQIRYAWTGRFPSAGPAGREVQAPPAPSFGRSAFAASSVAVAVAKPSTNEDAPDAPEQNGELVTTRPEFARQLALLAKFVHLCQANDIQLVVAVSPLRPALAKRYDQRDLAKVVERIAEVVPVWDFGIPGWLSKQPGRWLDISHFSPEVARMMLDRIFAGDAADGPKDFGVLLGRSAGLSPSVR
jgi:hypothetical protein